MVAHEWLQRTIRFRNKERGLTGMGDVRLMPDALASQVAAGEVVERPASVIKELVENAIDAGAGRIEVLVNRGGISLMRVLDDGEGMTRENALLAIERHATSKLRTKEDLDSIGTLGFRGEALPSIASVSRFRLTTRPKDALSGTEIVIEGGKLGQVSDSGEAPGTQVEVRSLFYNVPARRKFLRTEGTEFSHVEQQVRVQAIARPDIGFTLRHGERLVFQLPGGQSLRERIGGLVGEELLGNLREVAQTEREGIRISGYISRPGFGRANRSMQYTFLNRRAVENLSITYALKDAYRGAMAAGRHPVTFLFLELDSRLVDVNVHPAKKEVRFHDGRTVQRVLAETLGAALAPPPAETLQTNPAPKPKAPEAQVPESQSKPHDVRVEHEPALVDADVGASPTEENSFVTGGLESEKTRPPVEFRLIDTLGNGYVIMESEEGLVLMDPKAAHERVLYEEARRRMDAGGVPSQNLLIPLTIRLSPADFDLVRRNLNELQRMGISADEFGANTLKVDALPAFYIGGNGMEFMHAIIEELQSTREGSIPGKDSLAAAVCHRAVSMREPLKEPELEQLVRDLLQCAMPYCDPRGRPTLVQMSWSELERKFGRR